MLDQRLTEIATRWNKVEERLKEVEHVSRLVRTPSINELRYAGRQIVDALLKLDQDASADISRQVVAAAQYVQNADHGVTDALLDFMHNRLDSAYMTYGGEPGQYRRISPADADPDLDRLGECADRYNVSLIAATLRWLSFTARRAVLVVSRDGYILWSRASTPALRSGRFFRTSGSPVEVPASSIAANPYELFAGRGEANHAAGVWFDEPVREVGIHAKQYAFTISLLKLEVMSGREAVDPEDAEDDAVSRFATERSRQFAG